MRFGRFFIGVTFSWGLWITYPLGLFSLANTFDWDLSICISFHWDFLIWVDCNFEIVGAMFVIGSTSVTKQQMRDAGSFVISRLTNDRWARTGVAWTPTLRSWFSHKQTAKRQTDR